MAEIPLAVNAALALELYFKSLLTLEHTKFRWIHDLEKLFNKLPEPKKRRLIREHKKWEKDRIFHRLHAMGIKPALPRLLNMGRNAFDKFRYRHENPNDGTAWGLDVCLLLVRNIVHNRLRIEPHPALVEQYKEPFNKASVSR